VRGGSISFDDDYDDARHDDEPGAYTEPAPGAERVLRRSTHDKVIAGVAGGLGRYLGVDPVAIRIAFVALALAGASGVLIYAVLWVVMPVEEADDLVGAATPSRHTNAAALVVGGVLVAIGTIILVERILPTVARVVWPLLLIVIGIAVLLQAAHR
jgi:phage shock protein C